MERLSEVFVKSNRVALMWAMPFAVGLALFSGDLIHFVLGDRWSSARVLLIAIGLSCGIGQVAFNWGVFMRAANNTRPLFVASLFDLGAFFALVAPLTIAFGLRGYAAAFAGATAVQIAIRAYYVRRLFGAFDVVGQCLRAIAPTVPPAAIVLLGRLLIGGHNTPARAAVELAVYVVASVISTYALERRFVLELVGYLRGRVAGAPTPTVPAGA